MDERRVNPDKILANMRSEKERSREGRLKIFFGAAPGVGKTFAMLMAAHQKLAEGIDIVAGLVETHGRAETEALLDGLEALPRNHLEYKGAVITEFDLDAALRRRPEIILVDELAHTNAPVCRHKKRWQDIYELLGAGISVYTTMNVQHMESLNDIVKQITGVYVRETVPDFLLDRADDIELVDLPAEDLLQRLKEGKVYVPELAVDAAENFFRKGNLLALRELALRCTADRVDEQMQHYREAKGVTDVWPASERILVCVGTNPRSIRLIRAAKRMASSLKADWIAVNVEAPSKIKPSQEDLRQLSEHMALAESLGAETAKLSGHRASEVIIDYARTRNVTKIIIGKPAHPPWKDKLFGSVLDEIVRGSGDIDIYVISGDIAEPVLKPVIKQSPKHTDVKGWVVSILMPLLCTIFGATMGDLFAPVDTVMVYLLGIVIISMRLDKKALLLATFLSVAMFDFFFIPPFYTFYVYDTKYVFTFLVMFIVAYFISSLTRRVREHAENAKKRERTTAALFGLSKKLVQERGVENLSLIAINHISEVFSCSVVVLTPDDSGKLSLTVTSPATSPLDSKELSVAQWSFDHCQRAGLGTDTLSGAKAMYMPLMAVSKAVGVIGIMPSNQDVFLDNEQLHVLESFVNQTAMAIQRALVSAEAQKAILKAETETLRNTLLSSVSHDLRTPLSAITGAATTLLQRDMQLDAHANRDLVQTIYEEAEHLNQIIRNVLSMTRLEAGAITVKKEWQSIEEIVGVALNRLAERLGKRQVQTLISARLPLVAFDPLLIEQVLMNLLDNAIKYTPDGTPIRISASGSESEVMIEIEDRGNGIPPGEEDKIFDKFFRSRASGGGIGLGLAICNAIITAHGGRIWAENRQGGGAVFRFTLPVGGSPPTMVFAEGEGAADERK